MAERFAGNAFTQLARVEGLHHDGKPTVLFLCDHNAGRSQMALGFFTHLGVTPRLRGPAGRSPAIR